MRHRDRIRALAVSLVTLAVAMAGFAANTTVTYTFNGADQLTQVTSSQSGVVARFTYDGNNLRATKTVGSATVIYVRGPSGEVIAEYSASRTLLAEYVYLDGQRICKITKDGQGVERRVYYHSDIVGTPVVLTDEAGQLIAKAEYLPFGEEVVHGAAPDVHKFTGKELDDEIGLYDFGARYYDARLGRFISVDPVAGTNDDPQSWNRYAYGRSNPLRFVDRNGRLSAPWHYALTLVAATAAGYKLNQASELALEDVLVDIGSQSTQATHTNVHAMIGKRPGDDEVQTAVEARHAIAELTQTNVAKGTTSALATAEHTVQDFATPAHRDRVWAGFHPNHETGSHVLGDLFPSTTTLTNALALSIMVLQDAKAAQAPHSGTLPAWVIEHYRFEGNPAPGPNP